MAKTAKSLLYDHEFLTDFSRFSEGILDEKFLRRKYRFDDKTWETLGNDPALLEAIENTRLMRMRNGASKREKSQLLVMKAPEVADQIMMDPTANARHRLDACKVLNDFADPEPTHAPAADERFTIVINLGADERIKIDKAIGKV